MTKISSLTELTTVDKDADFFPIVDTSTTTTKKVKPKYILDSYTPTKGRILVGDGTNFVVLGVGTDGQALVADSAQTTGVKWAAAGISSAASFPSSPTLYDLLNHTGAGLHQCSVATPYIKWSNLLTSGAYYLTDTGAGYSDQAAYDTYWVSSDTGAVRGNPSNDNIDFNFTTDNTNDCIVFDLGSGNVSDTKWVLRFKINWTTITEGEAQMYVGLSDSGSAAGNSTSQDFIGVRWNHDGAGLYGSQDTDGAAPTNLMDAIPAFNASTATDYYFQIRRTSATAYIVERCNSSWVVQDSASGTCASTTASLRYIKIMNYIISDAGVLQGTIDDVAFWNGVTAAY